MKTSALNLDTTRGTVQVAYDGVQHQPNLLVLTDEEVQNLADVHFEVGDVIDASSIQKAFTNNCCCVYLKNWLKDGGDDVIIGGVTFKADGTQEGIAVNYEDINWPGSSDQVVLADGSFISIDDFAELGEFSNLYVEQTGNANDVMLGNNTAITIANLENRIVSDKNLVDQSVINRIESEEFERWELQDVENNSTRSRLSSLESRLTTTNANVATNTQNIANNTSAINTLGSSVASLGGTVSSLSNAVSGLSNQFVAKTGDTMSGELVVANSNYRTQINGAGILVWDRNTSPTTATSITPTSITSGSFILHTGTSDQILLGNGTTTSLSQITSRFGSYLPLTGGALSGDLNTSTKIQVYNGEDSSERDKTIINPNRIDLYDSNNEEAVSISCSDGVFVVYNYDLNDYGTVVCSGVQIPNATAGEIVMATGQKTDLYSLCGGNVFRYTGTNNIFKNLRSTGFLNIYDLFGEDAVDTFVTSGRLSANASEVVKGMFDHHIMPTNLYYRIGDGSPSSSTAQYIPVGCRTGFETGTFVFYFVQISMLTLNLIRIEVEGLDSQSNSTYEWTKTISNITTGT